MGLLQIAHTATYQLRANERGDVNPISVYRVHGAPLLYANPRLSYINVIDKWQSIFILVVRTKHILPFSSGNRSIRQ